jgi:siderophore synthetase component
MEKNGNPVTRTDNLSDITFKTFSARCIDLEVGRFDQIWDEACQQAQFEILKRLAACIIFEELAPVKYIDPKMLPEVQKSDLASTPQSACRIGGADNGIYVAIASQTHCARLTPLPGLYLLSSDGSIRKVTDPIDLFDVVIGMVDRFVLPVEKISRTRDAIQNSYENLACGICYKLIKKEFLSDDPDRAAQEVNDLIHYEQLVTTGHPVHPLTKFRSNISIEQTLQIAPEYNNRIDIGFVAVQKEYFRCSLLDPQQFQDWLAAKTKQKLLQRLPSDINPQDYRFIPVHGWQYNNWLYEQFKNDIAEKTIIPLGRSFIKAHPSLSLRTLYVDSADRDIFLKLPVNLQTTSYFRTVSPNATQNGVALSQIFRTISQNHSVFTDKTRFLYETEGAYYSPKPADEMSAEDIAFSKHLGYIVRQSPYEVIDPDDIPIVTIALVDHNRLTRHPVLNDLIALHTAAVGAKTLQQGALSWFQSFLDVSAEGLLTLMSRYGIGFEAHMQNTLTVVSRTTGTPRSFLLRDFGGIRVSMQRLAQIGFTSDFFPMSVTVKDDMQEVRNKLYYAYYQSVIGELVAEITSAYSISETELWEMTYKSSREAFTALKEGHPFPEWVDADFAYFVEKKWRFKSLLSMSLVDIDSDYVYTDITNPFYKVHERRPK